MATVVVQARRSEGRRRAGRFWPGSPVEVDLDEATLAELRSDPQLIVRAPRVGDDAAPVSGDTVESLRAERDELRAALAASRAAHEADVAALREPCAKCVELADLREQIDMYTRGNELLITERDGLRKLVTALEEAATAPATGKKK